MGGMTMSLDRRSFLGSSALAAGATLGGAVMAADETTDADRAKIGRTPHTEFAVNIEMWFRRLPFMERIKASAALGFPAYEFWPYEPHRERLDEIAQLSKELGIACAQFTAWGFSPGMNDPKNHDAFVEKMEDACQAAKRLNCKLMTVVAGDDIRGISQREMHENVIKALKSAVPICEKHGVTMILEPMNIRVDHKGHCLYGSTDALRICREVNSKYCKINWDLYHMQISEGDLCGHLKEGIDQIGYLQLADHPGRNEPGTGEVHYNRVLKQAHDLGYRGFVGLECVPKTDELTAAKRVAAADVW
jgi:hydroxypyruvate isomerase